MDSAGENLPHPSWYAVPQARIPLSGKPYYLCNQTGMHNAMAGTLPYLSHNECWPSTYPKNQMVIANANILLDLNSTRSAIVHLSYCHCHYLNHPQYQPSGNSDMQLNFFMCQRTSHWSHPHGEQPVIAVIFAIILLVMAVWSIPCNTPRFLAIFSLY